MHRKKIKGVATAFSPHCPHDTFMKCVSFFLHRNPHLRRKVRAELMFFAAQSFFYGYFASTQEAKRAYFCGTLVLNPNNRIVEFNSIEAAMDFIFDNEVEGVVSSRQTMARLVSQKYHLTVYINNRRVSAKSQHELASLHLKFSHKQRRFRLLMYDQSKITKVMTTPKFALYVSKEEKKMKAYTNLARKDGVHQCELENDILQDPRNLFTLRPINAYSQRQNAPFFVYAGPSDEEQVKLIASTHGDMNPYFFVEAGEGEQGKITLYVVEENDSFLAAKRLELEEKKIVNSDY